MEQHKGMCERYNGNIGALDVPGELLFRVTTWHVTLFVLNARLMRPYVHPLNVADFKGIRAG